MTNGSLLSDVVFVITYGFPFFGILLFTYSSSLYCHLYPIILLKICHGLVHFVDGSSSLLGSRFYCPPSSFWRVHWFYAFVMAVEIDAPLLHLCHGRGPLTQQHTERMELQNKKIVSKPMMKNQSQCSQSESLVKTF